MPIPPDNRAPGDGGHIVDHNDIADELTALTAAVAAETGRAEAAEAALVPLSDLPLSLASGGTGQAGRQAALNALTGTQTAGRVLGSDGTNVRLVPDGGVTIKVPAPSGVAATDTPNVTAAITGLITALASGPATLQFQDGTYQVDSNSLVIRSPDTTTVASASNGAEPSAWTASSPGTLTVASAASFPGSGMLTVAAGTTSALITYTGTTSTTFTGCVYLSGSATGLLATGGYVTLVLSDFTIRGTGGTVITQAPNTASKPNNTAGNLLIIADCADFQVENLTLDCLRDTLAPVTPLTATASSGQPSVTVAAGAAAAYQPGQRMKMYGGLGSSDQSLSDGYGTSLVISSITPGGGPGGGDLITFTVNLTNTYTQISSAMFSDGWGPYASAGAYIFPYQTGNATVAGRTLLNEDQQCALHLMNCTQFTVSGVDARNTWESQIRLGRFANSPADGCRQGTVTGCRTRHGYDQGVGLWHSRDITVTGCDISAAGWAGVDLCGSDSCTITGNQIDSSVYRVASSPASGSGVAIDGGMKNVIAGNTIAGTYGDGIHLDISPSAFLTGAAPSTAGSFAAPGVTTLQLTATTSLIAGGHYSLIDGARTEAVTVQSVTDGTHVALTQPTLFGHAAGISLTERVPEGNIIAGNTITSPSGSGILGAGVRNRFLGNAIYNAGGSAITLTGTNACAAEGNTCSGTGLSAIVVQGSFHAVRGNQVLYPGTSASPQYGIQLNGVTDCDISGNTITGGGKAGVNGSASRTQVSQNRISQCAQQGILFSTGADSLTVEGNTVTSCLAGIDLRAVTNSAVLGNACISNQQQGIILQNNSGTGCSTCRVTGNECRDDGSGINPVTGAGWTQQTGILESGASNYNLFTGNECDSNSSAQLTTAGANSYAWANILAGVITGNFPAALIPVLNQNTTGNAATATAAAGLESATTTVAVSAAAAPTSGQVLTATSGTAATWQNASGGLSNPMTAAGDLIDGGSGGTPQRLPIGSSNQVLTVVSGAPAWANASSGFSNPMTTAGDLLFENATPAPDRLPIGTKTGSAGQFLGVSSSSLPAWQNVSGQYLCTPTQYAPATQTSLTNTTTTLAAVSSANVNTGSFTAPASGSVTVTASLVCENSATSNWLTFGLSAHGTVTPLVCDNNITQCLSALKPLPYLLTFLVTGLTPGTSYNFDLLFGSSSGTITVLAYGNTSTTAGTTGGAPVTMTVQAV